MKTLLAWLCFALTSSTLLVAQPRPALLARGSVAPEFIALNPDNTPAKLSDLRGKTVIVDFWAPWCGPCKATMPHLEKLYQRFQSDGLVVLGVCVWEDRANFDQWLKAPGVPTSYRKVFDPAGRRPGDIARSKFHVAAIPTFYVVDPTGKIAYVGVGSGPQTAKGLEDALRQMGFKL